MTLFASTTVDALNAEIDTLIEQILADDANRRPECGGLHLDPFVDINPDRLPRHDARARDRIDLFLDRQDTTTTPAGQIRIVCPSPATARNIAALLRALGMPVWAIHLGGTP